MTRSRELSIGEPVQLAVSAKSNVRSDRFCHATQRARGHARDRRPDSRRPRSRSGTTGCRPRRRRSCAGSAASLASGVGPIGRSSRVLRLRGRIPGRLYIGVAAARRVERVGDADELGHRFGDCVDPRIEGRRGRVGGPHLLERGATSCALTRSWSARSNSAFDAKCR